MYALNIHNIVKVELKVTKLFNNFSSRDLVVTTSDNNGVQTEHNIGLYGKGHADLMPSVDGLVTHHYVDEDDDDPSKKAA